MVTKKEIEKVLSEIIDPDLGRDIVSLGFIKKLRIDGSKVFFDIELTTPACPIKEHFRKQAEDLVLSLDGVTDVFVNMTARQQPGRESASNLDRVGSIIAISSCKGGVGKSTIASTFASELASRGHKVGLLDLDIYGPSMPTLFDMHNEQIVERDGMIVPVKRGSLSLMSFGFVLGDNPAVMRGPMVSGYVNHLLTLTDWGELDYLFIDMPPGTGDIQLTMAQTVSLDGAIIVSTPAALSTVDVIKGIHMFEKVGVPIVGVVNNMAYFMCDNCDEKHFLFGEKDETLESRFEIQTVFDVPLEKERTTTFVNYQSNSVNQEMVDRFMRTIGKQSFRKAGAPKIELHSNRINLSWENGVTWTVDNKRLRENCKCALCVDEMTGEQILNPDSVSVEIKALEATPLGNYAVAVNWSDGHNSSIYTYELLDSLKR